MTAMTRVPMTDTTEDQRRAFAESLGLDLSDAKSDADVIALINTAWVNDWISVPELRQDQFGNVQADPALPAAQQVFKGGFGAQDPKVRLRIGETELPGGKDPFPIGVNGSIVVVQRKLVVDMPYRYYLALQNAVREVVTQDQKTRELMVSEVTNYPLVQVIAMPSAEQIADFHARTDNELMPA